MPLLSSRTTSPDPAATLEPIRIVTDVLELTGSIAPAGQRVTDLLLRGHDLAFLPRGARPIPEAWITVAPADILFVMPPPLAPRRDWKPVTHTQRVFVRTGGYRLIGLAHGLTDGPVDLRAASMFPFLPLTSVSIARDRVAGSEDVDVAIVNLQRAAELRS